MQCPQHTLSQISHDALFVDVFEIHEESTVGCGGSYEQIDDRMTRHFGVRIKWGGSVSQQLLVLFGAIGIEDRTADLCMPTVLLSGGCVKVDCVVVRS